MREYLVVGALHRLIYIPNFKSRSVAESQGLRYKWDALTSVDEYTHCGCVTFHLTSYLCKQHVKLLRNICQLQRSPIG